MGAWRIDGSIESSPLLGAARSMRAFGPVVFRLRGGDSRTVRRALAVGPVAELVRPGTSGRFYLHSAGSTYIYGIRTDDGRRAFAVQKGNETAFLIVALIAFLVAAASLAAGARGWYLGLPVLLICAPLYVLMRNARIGAERQWEADGNPRPA